MGSLFTATVPFPGADGATRRSLSNLKTDTLWLKKVYEAAARLKLSPELPVWKRDVWAHIGLPKQKIAVLITEKTTGHEFRDKWTKHGWTLLVVSQYRLSQMSVEEIALELSEAVKAIVGAR